MPNINITDSRKRDAVVKAENTGVQEEVRYVDADGIVASTRKVLKATVVHDFDTLNRQFGDDPEKLGYALIEGDPEVDMERCGVYLWGVSKVYVTSDDGIVYRIEQKEKVLDPNGEVKETRSRKRAEANVDVEIPLTWTGRKVKKSDAIRRFVFSSKLQVVHVNGLTYDFLHGMAKELDAENSLMMIGGGSDGKDPLVFRSGSIPYRAFLEGRVQGEQYVLLLHLSNMELKAPEAKAPMATAAKDETDSAGSTAKAESEKPAKAKRAKKKAAAKKSASDTSESHNPPSDEPATDKKASKTPATAAPERSKAGAKAPNDTQVDETAAAENNQTVADSGSDLQIDSEDLGVWLKSIRMGKYLPLFIENEIDVDVLADLSDDDLKELDIPLGSRRRLLKAVAEADNLRAEVAMAVSKISRSASDVKGAKVAKDTKKKKTKKKKSTAKQAGKRSDD
jgi:hypothetical protein